MTNVCKNTMEWQIAELELQIPNGQPASQA